MEEGSHWPGITVGQGQQPGGQSFCCSAGAAMALNLRSCFILKEGNSSLKEWC